MADIVSLNQRSTALAVTGTTAVATSTEGRPDMAAITGAAPHSVAAEQALLGTLMVNNRQFDDLQGTLIS